MVKKTVGVPRWRRKGKKTQAKYRDYKCELSITSPEDQGPWTQKEERLTLAHSLEDFSLWPGIPITTGRMTWKPLVGENFSMMVGRKQSEEKRNKVMGRGKLN